MQRIQSQNKRIIATVSEKRNIGPISQPAPQKEMLKQLLTNAYKKHLKKESGKIKYGLERMIATAVIRKDRSVTLIRLTIDTEPLMALRIIREKLGSAEYATETPDSTPQKEKNARRIRLVLRVKCGKESL